MRCFIGIWPDAPARARLDVTARDLHALVPAARRMRAGNLHLTLAFIGSLDEKVAARVAARLEEFPHAPFDWLLDSTGAFAGAHVAWAGGAEDERLSQLAGRTRDLLDTLAVSYDRKRFAAHVTLLRDVDRAAALAGSIAPPIVWRVEKPLLLRSLSAADGTRYAPFRILL